MVEDLSIWGQARGGRSRSREGSRAARRPGGGGEVARATEASAERARLTRPGVGPTVGGVDGGAEGPGKGGSSPSPPAGGLGHLQEARRPVWRLGDSATVPSPHPGELSRRRGRQAGRRHRAGVPGRRARAARGRTHHVVHVEHH